MYIWPFSKPNQISTWIYTVIILKPAFKTEFSVNNNYFNLCDFMIVIEKLISKMSDIQYIFSLANAINDY